MPNAGWFWWLRYEHFFGMGGHWDYITAANTDASVGLLPELLRRVVALRNEVARLVYSRSHGCIGIQRRSAYIPPHSKVGVKNKISVAKPRAP